MHHEDMITELSQNEIEQVSGAGCCLVFGAASAAASAAVACGTAIKAALFNCLPKIYFRFGFGCGC